MFIALQIIFWLSIVIILYTYVGYGIVLFLLVKIKRLFSPKEASSASYDEHALPPVTVLVAAYNEEDYIVEKIENSFSLNYPKNKLNFLFVTDGSDDATPSLIRKYTEIKLYHEPARKGKIAAVERVMAFVDTEIVVFTDANTMLNEDAVRNMVRHFADPTVGAVAGEKRVFVQDKDNASGAGEGFYWKYESKLKTWDSELYSVVGAAGELFAIRKSLFEKVPADTLIEDFYLTLSIAKKGYRVVYEPEAFALEGPSASVKDELKRKIRIAAGGIQAIVRLKPLLNIFRHGMLSFQYISHRVLRWTITPFALLIAFFVNLPLAIDSTIYAFILACQLAFYLLAIGGYLMAKRNIKIKVLFIPYYFCMMNYAVFMGLKRYLKGSQSVLWEKAQRANYDLKESKKSI